MEGYLTLEELANFLGVASTGSLRTQVAKGVLKAERVGRRTLLVSVAEAERYAAEHRATEGRRGRPPKPKQHEDESSMPTTETPQRGSQRVLDPSLKSP